MTTLAWVFFATTLLWLVAALVMLAAAVRLSDELTRQKRLFVEQERAHLKEIRDLTDRIQPPEEDDLVP